MAASLSRRRIWQTMMWTYDDMMWICHELHRPVGGRGGGGWKGPMAPSAKLWIIHSMLFATTTSDWFTWTEVIQTSKRKKSSKNIKSKAFTTKTTDMWLCDKKLQLKTSQQNHVECQRQRLSAAAILGIQNNTSHTLIINNVQLYYHYAGHTLHIRVQTYTFCHVLRSLAFLYGPRSLPVISVCGHIGILNLKLVPAHENMLLSPTKSYYLTCPGLHRQCRRFDKVLLPPRPIFKDFMVNGRGQTSTQHLPLWYPPLIAALKDGNIRTGIGPIAPSSLKPRPQPSVARCRWFTSRCPGGTVPSGATRLLKPPWVSSKDQGSDADMELDGGFLAKTCV